jgi:hypothetical protein
LGRSAHSWGINETEYFNLASNSREVHATAPEAAVAELANISAEPHAELGLTDFFVVPTITFRLLFVFVILSHDRRRPVHFAVTANPTAEWTARQLLEAFPWDTAPSYLLRDRDGIYGRKFVKRQLGSEFGKCLPRRNHPGRILTLSGSSDRFVASAWTTSSL